LIIAYDDSNDESVSFYTLEKLETLIRNCSLDKERLWKQYSEIQYEKEAMEMYNFLLHHQPIPGLHTTAHTLRDKNIYRQYLLDKDEDREERLQRKNQSDT
jgi:hypothetical protein